MEVDIQGLERFDIGQNTVWITVVHGVVCIRAHAGWIIISVFEVIIDIVVVIVVVILIVSRNQETIH